MLDIAFFLALIQIKHPTKFDCIQEKRQLMDAVISERDFNGGTYPTIKDDVDAIDDFYKLCVKKARK